MILQQIKNPEVDMKIRLFKIKPGINEIDKIICFLFLETESHYAAPDGLEITAIFCLSIPSGEITVFT